MDITTQQMHGLVDVLKQNLPPCNIFWDELIPLGSNWEEYLQGEMEKAGIVVAFLGMEGSNSNWVRKEARAALDGKKLLVPVFVNAGKSDYWSSIPSEIRALRGVSLPSRPEFWTAKTLQPLTDGLKRLFVQLPIKLPVDPDDPQKGRWGGKNRLNGRELTAAVTKVSKNWFDVTLTVKTVRGKPLTGPVTFHLHPSFSNGVQTVEADAGAATITLQTWGAFTVGAVMEDGNTALELDLAELKDAPNEFRER